MFSAQVEHWPLGSLVISCYTLIHCIDNRTLNDVGESVFTRRND
jgi:hypothetical protein